MICIYLSLLLLSALYLVLPWAVQCVNMYHQVKICNVDATYIRRIIFICTYIYYLFNMYIHILRIYVTPMLHIFTWCGVLRHCTSHGNTKMWRICVTSSVYVMCNMKSQKRYLQWRKSMCWYGYIFWCYAYFSWCYAYLRDIKCVCHV